jgi:hypothetical protein
MKSNQCPETCYQCDNRCTLKAGHPWQQMHDCGADHSK